MRAWTGIEIREERDKLERDVATLLGFMLFEYARLDTTLGMALAWVDGRKSLQQSDQLGPATLHRKLVTLKVAIQVKLEGKPELKETSVALLRDAHRVRKFRNALVHGRWGFEATKQTAVCVTGLPGSVSERQFRYTIPDLKDMLESIRSVRERLHELVTKKWL